MMVDSSLTRIAAVAALACFATAQDARPLAFVNARILTMTEAGTIEAGTVLIRDGRIEAVGADVTVPPGARIVDVEGGTIMPGFVHAWSRAGATPAARGGSATVQRGRARGRSRGGAAAAATIAAAKKIADELYTRQEVFGELLETGVTTLVVRPDGTGFPGLAARLAPTAEPSSAVTLDDDLYQVVAPGSGPKANEAMKQAFDKAKKVLEQRKQPPEPKPEAKPAEAGEEGEKAAPKEAPKEGEKPQPGEKPAEAKPEGAKPQPAKKPDEPKKDPHIEALADLLDGKTKAFLRVSSAMAIQHFRVKLEDFAFPTVVVADRPTSREGLLTHELDWLQKRKAVVLTRPSLDSLPNTRTLVNVPAELARAGVEVGFVLGDSAAAIENLPFELMELVRCGLPAEAALRGVTAVPAKAAGIADEVGSIAAGLRADLLVFSGDPLDPASRLRTVYREGREVGAKSE